MKNILNKYEALKAALEELGLDAETSRALSLEYRGAYCEVVISTEWLNYDCYIDRVTGELAGIDTMPQEDLRPSRATCVRSCCARKKRQRNINLLNKLKNPALSGQRRVFVVL